MKFSRLHHYYVPQHLSIYTQYIVYQNFAKLLTMQFLQFKIICSFEWV